MSKQESKNTKTTKYIKVAALKCIISSENNNIKHRSQKVTGLARIKVLLKCRIADGTGAWWPCGCVAVRG